jgi:hypothetical protein
VFCENETQSLILNQSVTESVAINCDAEEIRLEVSNGTLSHSRTFVPVAGTRELIFYMINETAQGPAINQEWQIYDITGLYENGIVRVSKVILDTGIHTMIEQIIDAEFKVNLFLIDGEKYIISVFDSDFGNERNIGNLDITDVETLNLEISNIPYAPEQRAIFRDVFVTFDHNTTTEIIRAIYNDTLSQTTNVTFTVFNASNTTQVMFWATSAASFVTFTYNNVDVNTTYIARIDATHTRYGQIREDEVISFADTGEFDIPGLEEAGLEIWQSIAAGFIVMFVMLAFDRKFAGVGAATGALIIVMFMQWGWFSSTPQVGWLMITVMAFVGLINVIGKRSGKS